MKKFGLSSTLSFQTITAAQILSTGGMSEVLANGTRSVNSCCVATTTHPIHTITGQVVVTTQQL